MTNKGYEQQLPAMRRQTSGRIFLGGHSYGGRQASVLAASNPVSSISSYCSRTRSTRRNDQMSLRTGTFRASMTPAMFVHGTRDGFGSIDEMVWR